MGITRYAVGKGQNPAERKDSGINPATGGQTPAERKAAKDAKKKPVPPALKR